MTECNSNCSSCGESCGERTQPQNLRTKQNKDSSIKRVIGVVSGKGGVGKSLVTSLLASSVRKTGRKAAIMDADITGPSIPQIFGLHTRAAASDLGLHPVDTDTGIKVMSLNLLVENETDPVIWRGPVIAGIVKQFWSDVVWGDVDLMLVDMPPGTGDVPLTAFQSLPLDGIIIVTSPQELVGMVVSKALNMAKTMDIPVLGIIENYSYFKCPDCGGEHRIFGESNYSYGVPVLDRLPIDPELAAYCDRGKLESYNNNFLENTLEALGYGDDTIPK